MDVSRVSASIVRIKSYSDDANVCRRVTNGTIFLCEPVDENGPFVCYILTSSDIFKPPERLEHEEQGVSPVYKIDVCLPTDILYEGEFMAWDKEMNISVITIKSAVPLPTATLAPFSDWISVSPFGLSESRYLPSQSPYPTKLFPGDEVTIVCSTFKKPHDPLVFSGKYSVAYIGCGFDRKAFLRINCERIIDGAPVINCEGDVIGVAVNVRNYVAFLPVSIFFKWWKQVRTYGDIHRPWLGIRISNLYTADIDVLESYVHDCGITDGVFVNEVLSGSPADLANMRERDVIYQCDGRHVRSLLEVTELLWDKVGEVIEARGVRDGCHFVWKVEIQAIKSGILPESLAKTVVSKDIPGILPESLAENVVTRKKSTERGTNKAKDKKKSRKAKDKKKSRKDKEVTGTKKAKTRKRKGKNRGDAAEKPEDSKKRCWGLS